MSTLPEVSRSIATKPCGCGSGGTTSHGCECGQPSCEQCAAPSFLRPRFFAGQLLTEEDLDLLVGYVAGKNRLHNRHLFGDGVVCGLEVVCHPCGGGKVVVRPGYALDCCGNDVVVPCSTELDVNAMVRRLRQELLGYDCGDPCARHERQPIRANGTRGGERAASGDAARRTEAPARRDSERGDESPRDDDRIDREYCLYVRYCEEQTDPVAPYATEEPCGHQACETTRVREGYRFELRCREPERPYDDLLARLRRCLGDLEQTSRVVAIAVDLQRRADDIKAGLTEIEKVDRDAATTTGASGQPQPATKAAAKRPRSIPVKHTGSPDEQVRALRQQLREIARKLITGTDPDEPDVQNAVAAADAIAAYVTAPEQLQQIASPVLRDEARHLAALSAEWKSGKIEPLAAETRLMAAGIASTRGSEAGWRSFLEEIRDWLLYRIQCATNAGDCVLRRDVESVCIPRLRPNQEPSASEWRGLTDAATPLVGLLVRYLLDCFCAAVNPPCRPCAEPGVLLACLTVRDCEVVAVCELERRFVMTGPALRYWLPLERLGRALEAVCCDARAGCEPGFGSASLAGVGAGTLGDTPAAMLRVLSSGGVAGVLTAAGVDPDDAAAIEKIGTGFLPLAWQCGLGGRVPDLLAALVGTRR